MGWTLNEELLRCTLLDTQEFCDVVHVNIIGAIVGEACVEKLHILIIVLLGRSHGSDLFEDNAGRICVGCGTGARVA